MTVVPIFGLPLNIASTPVVDPTSFIFTVTVGNGDTFQLPFDLLGNYNLVADWGDSNSDNITQWDQAEATHTYVSSGTYRITLSGIIEGWKVNDYADKDKIIEVIQWGSLIPGSLGGLFYGCSNLKISATDILNTSSSDDLTNAFKECGSLTEVPNITSWDTSGVKTTKGMFTRCISFNQPLIGFDTSEVLTMIQMFDGCTSFDQDLSGWDVSKVTSLFETFADCTSFNSSLDGWDVSSVMQFKETFRGCTSFNQHFDNWDVSSGTNFYRMFAQCSVFNQGLPWTFNAVSPISTSSMFIDCSIFNGDISGWNTGQFTNTSEMFTRCTNFNQDIGSWDVSNVVNFSNNFAGGLDRGMFSNCTNFNQDISGWITSSATTMVRMFQNCTNFNQDLGSWDLTNVTSIHYMFLNCVNFNQDLSLWNTSQITDFSGIFDGCLTFNQPVSSWDTSGLISASSTFHDCAAFNQDISSWDISSAITLVAFIDGSGIDTANYDLLLNAWSLLSVQSGVGLITQAQYTVLTSQSARDILTSAPNNWGISDGGGI